MNHKTELFKATVRNAERDLTTARVVAENNDKHLPMSFQGKLIREQDRRAVESAEDNLKVARQKLETHLLIEDATCNDKSLSPTSN